MLKLCLIHLLDKFDNYVLKHRFYWVCQKVGLSSWWGNKDCFCNYCKKWKSNE